MCCMLTIKLCICSKHAMLCCAVNVGGEILLKDRHSHLNVAVTGDHVLFAFVVFLNLIA